jgi:hypothetical protein
VRFGFTHAEAAAPARPGARFWLGGAVVAICLVILTAQTWRKWGDLLVDFGMQLYVPWKLSTGAVLYRDVAYLTGGPLSQYYHALLFRFFGVSLLTIVVSNLLILFLLAALIYKSIYQISDAWTATMAGLALALVFAFAQYRSLGTFNFVSPYSHEIVHGVALSILVLWLLSRWLLEEKIAPALWAGIGSGLVLLTKPEAFLALALAQCVAVVLFWRAKHRAGLLARSALAMAGGTLLPVAAFFLYFIRHESIRESLRSVLWAWAAVLDRGGDNEFYRWCLGLSAPGHHLKMILCETAVLAAILGVLAVLSLVVRAGWLGKTLWILAILAAGKLSLAVNWDQCGYALPALCVASLGLLLWDMRTRGEGQVNPLALLWSVFSLALLSKLGIYPRLWHYGFILAMPAFLTAVYFLLWQLPSVLERQGAKTIYFRAAVSLALLIGFGQLWLDSKFSYAQRTAWVGQGPDKMLAYRPAFIPSGVTLGRVANWLQTNTPPSRTLAVLPDGSMLNYLLRCDNPSGYLRWNLAESTVFGQDNMDRAFMSAPPDYIVLVDFTISQFSLKPFGQDPRDGLELKHWIDGHYRKVYQTGPPAAVVYQRSDIEPLTSTTGSEAGVSASR